VVGGHLIEAGAAAGGLAGRAGAELVALDQHDVRDACLGEVEGDAGADDAAADYHDAGPLRKITLRSGHSATRRPTPSVLARSTIAQAAAASCTPRPRLL
jgi:hypothetical protein